MRPPRIWLVADGPKQATEAEQCLATRREAEKAIDWPCEVFRVYAETNMGLRARLETGLDSVFAREEEAVLLEEDCHPTDDFFAFGEAMLDRYRGEARVGGISGNCFLPAGAPVDGEYFFSRYLHIWGWATWARVWQGYDRAAWRWPAGGLRDLCPAAPRDEVAYWNRVFAQVVSGKIDTWDYRWVSHLWTRGCCAVVPTQNLIRNRGFGTAATNTHDASVDVGIKREGRLIPPFRGPERIQASQELDRLVFQNHFVRMEARKTLFQKIISKFPGRLFGAASS